ncbi:MAG: cysteine--tRNA ligase [Gammaproteobacteria bacterium]|nr:cysteine--tRNA ligase [Gammaproteobacteria bacterium]
MLAIHNSQTRRKERFVPLVPGKVRMYVCGLTVYDLAHLGHARMLIVFDVVARYLRFSGYELTYVRNITDIDDKIIARAAANGETVESLTERFIAETGRDCAALRLLPPDHEPRATGWMPAMRDMIQTLLDKGYAYQAGNGDVYYEVGRFEAYGRLSGRKLDELRAGARVEVDAAKRDPLDFVLWKTAKPGEPSWDAPWGRGRPGWHIECSAMATSLLGEHFDIHGGGMDLQFPHHENEIAQAQAATGAKFVNLWMHNGFVRVDEEKMSKSLGNIFTVRDILEVWQAEVVRYFVLGSHYRSPLNYAGESLQQAKLALDRLYIALRDLPAASAAPDSEPARCFLQAMDDDFNTAEAIAVLQMLAREINSARAANDIERAAALGATLRRLGALLGIAQEDPDVFLKARYVAIGSGDVRVGGSAEVDFSPARALAEEEIERMIRQRDGARRKKNWAKADEIRKQLELDGVLLEDSTAGTTWRRAGNSVRKWGHS